MAAQAHPICKQLAAAAKQIGLGQAGTAAVAKQCGWRNRLDGEVVGRPAELKIGRRVGRRSILDANAVVALGQSYRR